VSVAPIGSGRVLAAPRAAAIAGVVFAVLFSVGVGLIRLAVPTDPSDPGSWLGESDRRNAVGLALNLIPFAGIAFLWFMGVVRSRLGAAEDQFFATVFLGSGLLFLALVFVAAVTSLSLMEMLESTNASQDVWTYGRNNSQGLISVYAMRMAAVFTLSVSTAGLRAAALPRWVCYVGYLVALALLVGSANQRWLQLLFPAWVLLVSAAILLRSPADRAPAS
jgi:hypothetical protein